mmetsp:Transcript_31947/g.69002  ORF Transcript_31947/g.69002 Transcript_31947/m.69002 type:complete len:95 (-) Transcript_31947:2-286(-)
MLSRNSGGNAGRDVVDDDDDVVDLVLADDVFVVADDGGTNALVDGDSSSVNAAMVTGTRVDRGESIFVSGSISCYCTLLLFLGASMSIILELCS